MKRKKIEISEEEYYNILDVVENKLNKIISALLIIIFIFSIMFIGIAILFLEVEQWFELVQSMKYIIYISLFSSDMLFMVFLCAILTSDKVSRSREKRFKCKLSRKYQVVRITPWGQKIILDHIF